MGNITRKAAIENIHKAIKSLYRNTFKPDGHLVYISENMEEHKVFHDKVERLYNLSKSKAYNLELECLSFEKLSLYYNKIKKLSDAYRLDNYPVVSKTMLINKQNVRVSNRMELERMDKSDVIRYFYALMKVYAFEALESNCEETQKLKLEYLDPSVKDKRNVFENLEEIKSVYDINNKKIKELKNDIQKNENLRNSIRPVGGFDFSDVASQFQMNIDQDNANICILQYQNMLLAKKYPEVLFVKKNKNVPEELQEGFRKVEEAQDKLFEDIRNDNVPLIQIDFIREKALETIKSEYKNEEAKIQLVLKEIKNKQTVEFWVNVGRTAVPLLFAAFMFFTPAGSIIAIAVATGSAVADISASIWDFHDARISNELAYSSAIGNEFSSTSMASADFQYGMAIFNMVLSAVSISEIKNATKAYKSFNGLSKEAQKNLNKINRNTSKRLLSELKEDELTKLLTSSESRINKLSKLSTKQIKEVLNCVEMNDILKAVDEIPVDKFDDVVCEEIIKNLGAQKSSANKKQVEAVKNITNPNKQLENGNHNFTMKCNYGEMKTDIDLEKDGLYERVSNFRVESLSAKGHHGIDGIYRNANPPPDFIIVDSKYLGTEKAVNEAFAPRMSKVENGTQMDAKWIRKNLEDSIDDESLLLEIKKAIRNNRVDSVAAKIDSTGKVTYYKLDYNGKIIKDNVTNKPIIYNIKKD